LQAPAAPAAAQTLGQSSICSGCAASTQLARRRRALPPRCLQGTPTATPRRRSRWRLRPARAHAGQHAWATSGLGASRSAWTPRSASVCCASLAASQRVRFRPLAGACSPVTDAPPASWCSRSAGSAIAWTPCCPRLKPLAWTQLSSLDCPRRPSLPCLPLAVNYIKLPKTKILNLTGRFLYLQARQLACCIHTQPRLAPRSTTTRTRASNCAALQGAPRSLCTTPSLAHAAAAGEAGASTDV
jgi:hypothetical protein